MERTTPDGKTAAVHFMRFAFSEEQKRDFLDRPSSVQLGLSFFIAPLSSYQDGLFSRIPILDSDIRFLF